MGDGKKADRCAPRPNASQVPAESKPTRKNLMDHVVRRVAEAVNTTRKRLREGQGSLFSMGCAHYGEKGAKLESVVPGR